VRKHQLDWVRQYFLEHGCELLSENYEGAHARLEYKCSCGNKSTTSFTNFQQGKRCRQCGNKVVTSKTRLSYNYVINFFKERDCELLEDDYVNSLTSMRYRCSCGNLSRIRFGNFQQGKRCGQCAARAHSGRANKRWVEDREAVALNTTIRKKFYRALNSTLKATGKKKATKSTELLGYGPKELKEHLAGHPDWHTLKEEKWHLDHIFPIKAFTDHGISDPRIINCLENLRPISACENYKKNCSYDKQEFLTWLSKKIAP